jgi:cell division protein FtsQ
VWFSPIFALDPAKIDVTIDGPYVDGLAVQAALDPFLGTALPRLDIQTIESAIDAVQGVREATVTRSWPRGLLVAVAVRRPVAAIADAQVGYLYVDSEGVGLATATERPTDLPVVTVPVGEGNSRILAATLAVAGALPPELSSRVEAVRAETEDSVTLFLRDGPRVEWGSGSDSSLKAAVLLVLLQSDLAGVAVIDVSAPTLPITHG